MPEVAFNGSAGRLEGRYQQGSQKNSPLALVLHPNPVDGGTMNNKVTYALFRSFSGMGFNTLRFNFRGVGKSEGIFDYGEGELSDAAAALDWLQMMHPASQSFWVGGFSFGAWIGMQLLMRRPEVSGFVEVSSPADKYDFNFLAPCPVSGQIFQGDNDIVVNHSAVDKLVNKLSLQRGITIDYQKMSGADHFFTNQLGDLSKRVEHYVRVTHFETLKKTMTTKMAG